MSDFFVFWRPGLPPAVGLLVLAGLWCLLQLALLGYTIWAAATGELRRGGAGRLVLYWVAFYLLSIPAALGYVAACALLDDFGPVVFIGALLAAFTVWSYLGHPQATRKRVTLVLLLRLLALLAVLVTAVRPSLGRYEQSKEPAVLLVGVDVSESMTVKDELGGRSRIDAVRQTLEKCQPIFDELKAERGVDVVVYRFGPPDFDPATSLYTPDAPADAKRSDYGTYFNRIAERWKGGEVRVRAQVVIGDGVDNGEKFRPADEAARPGAPVNTFLVGSESSQPDAKDIAVTAIECNPSPAYIKNRVLVTARVNAYNFTGAKVTARVSINDKPANQDQDQFTLEREKDNELKISVETPAEKGEYKVKVEVGVEQDGKVVALPGELSPLNNWSETYLTVLKEGVRVLIVDQLRWEETMLRDALRNEKRFDVYEVIRQATLEPSDAERALLDLEKQAYDVVIIGNVSADHLRKVPNFLRQLTDLATKKGVGVMFLGGEFAYQGMPEELLPVAGGPIIDALDKSGNPEVTFPAVPTARGVEKMFRVAGKPGQPVKPGESEALWDRMNNSRARIRLNGHNRLTVPPGGRFTVFAWTSRLIKEGDSYRVEPADPAAGSDPAGEPLLVGSQRGDASKGRWLAFGAFDTYLWRGLGQPKTRDGIEMHERFWRQCVLWLAHQDEEESQVYARPQFRQLKVTKEQTVRVGMKKADGTDDPAAPLTVRVVPLPPGKQEPDPKELDRAPAQPVLADKDGRKVLFRAPAPGEYFVSVTTPQVGADGKPVMEPDPEKPGQQRPKLLRGAAKFIAIPDVSDEMLRVNADPEFMKQLTGTTGGKSRRLEELPAFLKELKAEASSEAEKKRHYWIDWRRNHSHGFLPAWLVAFVALLGAEWALRRLWGMV